jgi:hypothetical protein
MPFNLIAVYASISVCRFFSPEMYIRVLRMCRSSAFGRVLKVKWPTQLPDGWRLHGPIAKGPHHALHFFTSSLLHFFSSSFLLFFFSSNR